MHWPATPVERLQAFRPSFCPWPECSEHRRRTAGFRFDRHGHYATQRRPAIPRFRCRTCRRSFSRQSFATSYYLKRPELLVPTAAGLVAGSAHRQIARSLGCAPSTITRLSARLGRHALLLQALALRHLAGRLAEPVAADHFETFEFSQDFPFGVLTLVGRESWFVFGLDPAPHARTGKVTPVQAARLRTRPRRPRRGGYRGSFRRGLDLLLPLVGHSESVLLACDGKPPYVEAVAGHPLKTRLQLEVHPNPVRGPKGTPRSPEAVARDQALYPVDQLHALLRHTRADHKRETIAFGRRLNAIMERLFLAAAWRNFIKGRSERRPDRSTPAMRLGLAGNPWTWKGLLARRLFPARARLHPLWRELYRRAWLTPVLPRNRLHARQHAA
jgi:transposase-like protein